MPAERPGITDWMLEHAEATVLGFLLMVAVVSAGYRALTDQPPAPAPVDWVEMDRLRENADKLRLLEDELFRESLCDGREIGVTAEGYKRGVLVMVECTAADGVVSPR